MATAAIFAATLASSLPSPIGPAAVSAAPGDPAARWTFDAGSGANVDDAIGSADGTRAGGTTWITSGPAVGAGAMHFDGVDGRVEVAGSAALEPQGGLTITAWVRGSQANPPTAGQVIMEKGAFGCDGASYGLYAAANGIRLSFRAYDGTYLSGVLTEDFARTPLWDGNWHLIAGHVLWVAGGTGGLVYGYISVDGSPRGNPLVSHSSAGLQDGSFRYTGASDSGMRLGGPVDASCATDYFKGDIDDARVYSDGELLSGSLMPPVATTTTLEGPATANPEQLLSYTVNVSPAPRWGEVRPEIFYDGGWHTWNPFSYVPDADGNVTFEAWAPTGAGTFPVRANYVPNAQYQASSDGHDLVVSLYPTTTTLQVTPSPTSPFQDQTLTATVTSGTISMSLYPKGSVEFYDVTSGTPVLLGTSPVEYISPGTSRATFHVNKLDMGTKKLRAKYIGPDEIRAGSQGDFILQVNKASTVTSLNLVGASPMETNHSFQLAASVSSPNNYWASNATMTFRRVGTSTPICTVAVSVTSETRCTVPPQPLGNWQYTVTYSGNTRNLTSTSAPVSVSVVADVVHATSVKAQYTTFYPYKDGYRDTVALTGYRQEPIGVTIKVYTPGGTLITTATIAQGSGAYAYAWTGRKSDGTIRPEGQYKITQTLKDAAGVSKTYTFYVTLSKKKLIWHSTSITKKGTSFTASGKFGAGSIYVNTDTGVARLRAPNVYDDWAGVGYEFTLHDGVAWKDIVVKAYAKAQSLVGGVNRLGAQDFADCAYSSTADWDESCFDTWKQLGNSSNSLAWYSTSILSSTHRSGTKVRSMVSVEIGTVYVYNARVTYKYATLGY